MRFAGLILLSAAVSWLATRWVIPHLRRRDVMDVPNRRSSHLRPTPRGGGLGIVAGLAGGMAVAYLDLRLEGTAVFALALLLVATAGLVDDLRGGIPILLRLAVQIVAALLIVETWGPIERFPLPSPLDLPLGQAAWPLTLLWLIGVTNLTNFLDGIDGFAASQGLLAGCGLGLLGLMAGDAWLAATGAAFAGACLGFLPHNWTPARVFPGDVGSSLLGFGLAAVPLTSGQVASSKAVFVTAILMWTFLGDGTLTLTRRALRGEPVWRAHREHFYQRLARTGLSHGRVVLGLLAPALIPAALVLFAVHQESRNLAWAALTAAVTVTLGTWLLLVRRERLA